MARDPLSERTVRAIEAITRQVEERGEPLFHSGEAPLPQKREVIAIVRGLQEVIYPGYFGDQSLYREYLHGHLGDQLFMLSKRLEGEVCRALAAPCRKPGGAAVPQGTVEAREVVTAFFERLPEVMELIGADVGAAYEGDPGGDAAWRRSSSRIPASRRSSRTASRTSCTGSGCRWSRAS